MRYLSIFAAALLLSPLPAQSETPPRATVWIFTAIDCPIANGYAPELIRIQEDFAAKGIRFALVYPEPTLTESEIRAHLSDYRLEFEFHHDRTHERVSASGVSVTPEVAVFDADDRLVYRGRIDNRYSEYGDRRNSATKTDLRDVLKKLAGGRAVAFHETEPIGCFIEDLSGN